MSKTFIFAASLATIAVASCNDEAVLPTEDSVLDTETVTVEDGILHFATSADYFDFSLKMANEDPEKRMEWEKEHHFTSMLSFAERITEDSELHLGEALARPDIFSVSEDSVVSLEVPVSLASVANADGYYYVGDIICKVDKEFSASINGGSLKDADRVLSDRCLRDGEKGLVYRYAGEGNLKSASPDDKKMHDLRTHISNNHDWMDYRIRVYIIADQQDLENHAFIKIEQSSKNYRKRKRRWRDHKCVNTYMRVCCDVSHPMLYNSERLYVSDYSGKSYVNHSHTVAFSVYRRKGSTMTTEQPYFIGMNGTIMSESIGNKTMLDLYFFFNDLQK